MVSTKHKALALKERTGIIEGLKETERMIPSREKIMVLIDTYNTLNGVNVFSWEMYCSCGGCQTTLKDFWKYIVREWQKTS